MENILTFDLEDWYHGNFDFKNSFQVDKTDRVIAPTEKLLDILKETNNFATFFALGFIAEKFPELIKKIHAHGHEIASHSYDHNLVYNLTPDEFEKDLLKSLEIIESIIEEKVVGFRAPYWSMNRDMNWAMEILSRSGIVYDSSIYPYKTYLYGDSNAPRFKYELNRNGGNSITEIPPSILTILKKRIPFCGGFYFRLLPYRFVKWGIKQINEKEKSPAVFYMHPYEIDVTKPKSSKGFRNNFILHVNIQKAEKKLRNLLTDFKFISIKSCLNYVF